MKKIASTENPRFKALLKLVESSRERKTAGLSVLDGVHLIAAYREHVGAPVEVAISDSGAQNDEVMRLVDSLSPLAPVQFSDPLFRQLSTVATPTGVLATVKTPRPPVLPAEIEACVMVEDIQDPGNLGSLLRSAAAAGIRQVFLSKSSVHAWSPRVLRAGMGAHFMLNIYEQCELEPLIRAFKGHVIATSHHARTSVYELDLAGQVALLFGNEGAGLSPGLLDAAHAVAKIPMPGKAESLNIAAAAAVCLFERVRQERVKSQ